MKLLFLRAFIIGLAYLALLSCAKPKSQPDCGFVKNKYGERVSWNNNVPVRIFLHNSVPLEYEPAIRRAAETWNRNAGRTLLVIEDHRVGGNGPAKDFTNVIYFMSTWESEKASEQARTPLRWLGDQIQEADILINAAHYKFYTTEARVGGRVNIEALVLHEMGHVLGLDHKSTVPSVMDIHLKEFDDRISLLPTDSESLKCEY